MMYALGDRYQIPGLKECSLGKFEQLCKTSRRQVLSADVVRQVYEGTLETDRPLRDLLIKTLCQNKYLLNSNGDLLDALKDSH